MRDKVDSNSALQLPVIELLERIVRRLESPNREAANESLRKLLGTKIYDSLSEETLTCAVGAEQVLSDSGFAHPGLGVAGLCQAFELQLKKRFLPKLHRYLRDRGINNYPDNEIMPNGWPRPSIISTGRPNQRLPLGDIRLALQSEGGEFREFCRTNGINIAKFFGAMEVVQQIRNPAVHEAPISFEGARRIRDKLLGVQARDGGVFAALSSMTG